MPRSSIADAPKTENRRWLLPRLPATRSAHASSRLSGTALWGLGSSVTQPNPLQVSLTVFVLNRRDFQRAKVPPLLMPFRRCPDTSVCTAKLLPYLMDCPAQTTLYKCPRANSTSAHIALEPPPKRQPVFVDPPFSKRSDCRRQSIRRARRRRRRVCFVRFLLPCLGFVDLPGLALPRMSRITASE